MKKICFMLLVSLSVLAVSCSFAQTYGGYTLYSKMGSTKTYLRDMSNSIYHQWTSSGNTGYSCYLLPGGTLLRTMTYSGNQLSGAAMCGAIQKYSYSGTLLWQYIHSSATYCSHHDICPMPNGNVLMICYEVKSSTEAVTAGCSQNMTIWSEKIIEVKQTGTNTGTIVWEWHLWDHLVQDHDASKANYGVIASHPELLDINYNTQMDWLHANGIDYNPLLDQIIFSSHYLNELYIIDHSTTTAQAASHTGGNSGHGGDFIYRWGNPQVYDAGNYSNQIFKVVHDAHWIKNGYPGAGKIVAFNNKGISNTSSCVDMIIPPYIGYNYSLTAGSAYLPSTYSWRHTCLSSAQDQSNSQKLPNGNMLVCIASSGYIYEIDSNQNLLWSYTAGGTVAKAFRYSAEYIAGGLSVVASASPSTICSGGSSQLSATVAGGTNPVYTWISSPAGFSSSLQNPVVSPTVTTTYIVYVLNGDVTAADSVTINVGSGGTPVVTWTNALTSQCTGTTSYTLSGGSPSGGTYSGAGVSGNIFNASLAGAGTHSLTYTYSNGSCSASATNTIVVNPVPVVTMGSLSSVCVNSSAFALSSGSPAGGTYYGSGVVGGSFYPAVAGVGNHTISYVYYELNSCPDTAYVNITVYSDAKISGISYYNNASSSILDSVVIYLKQNNILIDSTLTDSDSAKYQFDCNPDGTYKLSAGIDKPFALNSVNALDALIIAKYSVGLMTLTPFRAKAADVNGNGYVNSVDALLVLRRFAQAISTFPAGDWICDTTGSYVSVSGSDVYHDFQFLYYGDVNGSYIPVNKKLNDDIIINKIGYIDREPVMKVPLYLDYNGLLGSFSMIIRYDGGRLTGISGIPDNLSWFDDGKELRIGWYSIDGLQCKIENAFLEFEILHTGSSDFRITYCETEFSDTSANIINEIKLSVPEIVNQDNIINLFPNPANDVLIISAKEQIQKIQISDMLGRIILSGNYNDIIVSMGISRLKPGIYSVGIQTIHNVTARQVVIE